MPISKRDFIRLEQRIRMIFPSPGSDAEFQAVMDAVEDVIPLRFVSDKQKNRPPSDGEGVAGAGAGLGAETGTAKGERRRIPKTSGESANVDAVEPGLVTRHMDRIRLHYERNKEWLAPQRTNHRREKKASEKKELEEAVARNVAAMKAAAAAASAVGTAA